MVKKRAYLLILMLILIISVAVTGCGNSGGKTEPPKDNKASSITSPVNLRFASFSVGGSWYLYAAHIAEVVKPNLPQGSNIDVLPYAGGQGNPQLVQEGKADLALSFNVSSKGAYDGNAEFGYDKKHDKLRALVGGIAAPYRAGVMVTKKSGITDIAQVKEKKMPIRVVTVQLGGMGEILTRQVLNAYGITYDDITAWGGTVRHVDLKVCSQTLKDGQADFWIQNIAYRQPDIVEMAQTSELRFLPLNDDAIQKLSSAYGYEKLQVESGEFKGVDQAVQTVGYETGVIASSDMSDDMAYLITKSVLESRDKLAQTDAAMASLKLENAWKPEYNNLPLHPGAEKYYREKGLIK